MEGQPADRIRLGPVFLVAGDGMADVGGMDTDLVLPAAFQGEFRFGVITAALVHIVQDAVMGDSQVTVLDLFRVGIHFQGFGIFHEPALDGSLFLLQFMLQEGDIAAFDDQFFPAALQQFLRPFALGEDNQAGSAFVDAVDDPDLGRGPVGRPAADEVFLAAGTGLHLHIGVQDCVQGCFLVRGFPPASTGGGNRQEPRGLVHDDIVVVFIDNGDACLFYGLAGAQAVVAGDGNRFRENQQGVSGEQRLVEGRFLLPVHQDLPFGELELTAPEALNRFSYHPEQWRLDGAETVQEVTDRVVAGLQDLSRRHEGQTIAIATHGTALRTTLKRLFPGRASGHADNTAVTLLTCEDGVFYLKYLYDNSHLEAQISTLAHQKWWKDPNGRIQDENLWYRPMTKDDDATYIAFRQDAWDLIYPGVRGFDGPGFLADAWRCAENEPRALVLVMLGHTVAGCLQLNMSRGREEGAGYIPFFYLKPEFRGRELGVQLIGHAISVFRPLGRTKLQLSVAPSNERAIRLYEKLGFRIKQAGKPRKKMSLHLMEMDISVN